MITMLSKRKFDFKVILHSRFGLILIGLFVSVFKPLWAQVSDSTQAYNARLDSLYITEIESKNEKAKVLHAEPLFIDLIRDLGARKGEREWNVGLGLTDFNRYDQYEALVEYEWAPINRLGLEVELPFSFYYPLENGSEAPSSRLNSLKLAAQWSYYVSDKHNTSLALGYLHEFELIEFERYGQDALLKGHVFNPFAVAAKRWGQNVHTLIYAGPVIERLNGESANIVLSWNSSLHYMIPGTRNFVGIEFNKEWSNTDFEMTVRPQMRLVISDQLMVGIVTGIPVSRNKERFSSFLRLIYEPGHGMD